EAGAIVVDEVISAGLAVAVVERLVGQRGQVIAERLDAGLARIGARDIGAGLVAGLCVPIVGAGPGIGILDLIAWRRRRLAVDQEECGIAGTERDVVGAGTAHHGLMIVVGERIAARELAEIGRVALGHVVEAHGDGALVRAGVGIVAFLRAFARGLVDPDEQILTAAIHLLPHLEEAVNGIPHRRGPVG